MSKVTALIFLSFQAISVAAGDAPRRLSNSPAKPVAKLAEERESPFFYFDFPTLGEYIPDSQSSKDDFPEATSSPNHLKHAPVDQEEEGLWGHMGLNNLGSRPKNQIDLMWAFSPTEDDQFKPFPYAWGIQLEAAADLDPERQEELLKKLDSDVAYSFGARHVDKVRQAADILFRRLAELKRVIAWFYAPPGRSAQSASEAEMEAEYVMDLGQGKELSLFVYRVKKDDEEKDLTVVKLNKSDRKAAFQVSEDRLRLWLKAATTFDFEDEEVERAVRLLAKPCKDVVEVRANEEKGPYLFRRLSLTGSSLGDAHQLKI